MSNKPLALATTCLMLFMLLAACDFGSPAATPTPIPTATTVAPTATTAAT